MARMREARNAYRYGTLEGNFLVKCPLERSGRIWQDITLVHLEQIG
jgi:hypothetical protein